MSKALRSEYTANEALVLTAANACQRHRQLTNMGSLKLSNPRSMLYRLWIWMC